MSAVSKSGRIYDVKNLYGLKQTIATQKAMISATNKRSFVISRSMFPSGGRYAAHALGYTPYSFSAMARSVTAIQEFNMFGIPFVGADVCGSVTPNWWDELNNRWIQLSASYPLSLIRKDPYSMITIDAMPYTGVSLFRNRVLPYLYT
ncbi:unnamed protein product [Anisakis simplex]|uniref:Peptidase_S15 domain-containing protein n=1 Tax=Anisakis simplex TaxID=6269 RepID=A0A0M3J8F3_ANISI|nr:unnamed protein product [Anisakis simplex]